MSTLADDFEGISGEETGRISNKIIKIKGRRSKRQGEKVLLPFSTDSDRCLDKDCCSQPVSD